jgi:alpha-galactosidase
MGGANSPNELKVFLSRMFKDPFILPFSSLGRNLNAEYGKWSKPGSWNDPDYLQIGWIGAQKGATFTLPEPSQLSANEQYSYMSLWCMMASPLFFSGDMTKLDKFTLNVLCNPEIIEIDQDPLGKCAEVIRKNASTYIMVKPLHDGSLALALFNQGSEPATVNADWSEINLSGKQRVRDLWRHRDLGIYEQKFSALIPSHGVVMVKLRNR